jgi:hypothetical protein
MNVVVGKHNRRFRLQRSGEYSLQSFNRIAAARSGECKGKKVKTTKNAYSGSAMCLANFKGRLSA